MPLLAPKRPRAAHTALKKGIESFRVNAVHKALAQGADPNEPTRRSGFLSDEPHETALFMVIRVLDDRRLQSDAEELDEGELERAVAMMDALVAHGANVRYVGPEGVDLLTLGMAFASPRLVQWVLQHAPDLATIADKYGEPPLHRMMSYLGPNTNPAPTQAIMRLIQAHGGAMTDLNADQQTPLGRAAAYQRPICVQALLEAGASAAPEGQVWPLEMMIEALAPQTFYEPKDFLDVVLLLTPGMQAAWQTRPAETEATVQRCHDRLVDLLERGTIHDASHRRSSRGWTDACGALEALMHRFQMGASLQQVLQSPQKVARPRL